MLLELRLKNFVLIEELGLSFEPGFTVFTGETGAGKSLLVKALRLLLGEKAAADYIRPSASQATVEALIYGGKALEARLKELGLEPSEEVLIVRNISKERSRCYLNGTPVPLKVLSEVVSEFVFLTGQHEFRRLFSPTYRLQLLDSFSGLRDEVSSFQKKYFGWKTLVQKIQGLREELKGLERERELLEFQIREIEEARPDPEEETELEREREVLRNLSRLKEGLFEASARLERAIEEVSSSRAVLSPMSSLDQEVEGILERITSSYYELSEALRDLEAKASVLPEDDSRLEEVEERLSVLSRIKRKYGPTLEDALKRLEEFKRRLSELEEGSYELEAFEAEAERLEEELLEEAKGLSKRRREASYEFSRRVEGVLRELALPEAEFEVRVESKEALPENLGPYGLDEVSFWVRLNPGVPEAPVERVASGGELSRIFLALKCVVSEREFPVCLVFDEVDSGIGGVTARRVGERLKELSRRDQVICVTHLPQIARLADHHFVVEKFVRDGKTLTSVRRVFGKEREEEILRMKGEV